jgi:hypothetical protein
MWLFATQFYSLVSDSKNLQTSVYFILQNILRLSVDKKLVCLLLVQRSIMKY